MFEAVQHMDLRDRPGAPVEVTNLGTFAIEDEALGVARQARDRFVASNRDDYAWWVVRQEGARLARWIADSRSEKEFVLDLRSGQLVEI